MSIKMMTKAMDADIKDALGKLVLLVLADHYNDSEGCAWPSINRICEITHCHRATIMRKLKALEEGGFISREKRYNATDVYRMFDSGSHSATSQSATFEVAQSDTILEEPLTIKKKEVRKRIKISEWTPNDTDRKFATDKGFDPDLIMQMIRDWDANQPKPKTVLQPDAFWRNWIRNQRTKHAGGYVKPVGGITIKERRTLTREMWEEATPALRAHIKVAYPFHEWSKFESKYGG